MKRFVAIILLITLAASCKSPSVDCNYNIKLYEIERKGADRIPLQSPGAYAFYVDMDSAEGWEVLSYSDAVQGIITNSSGEQRTYDAVPVAASGGGLDFNFTTKPVMVVAFDRNEGVPEGRKREMFAYGNTDIREALDKVNVSLNFYSYMSDTLITNQGKWRIRNESVHPNVECVVNVTCVEVAGEGRPETPLSDVGGFVIEGADISRWSVASYADAVAGILTSRSDGSHPAPGEFTTKALTPDQTTGNILSEVVTSRPVVLIVFDRSRPMYAFATPDQVDNPDKIDSKLIFAPYLPQPIPSGILERVNEGATVEIECNYTLATYEITSDGGAESSLATAGAYYLELSSLGQGEWYVASYADAVVGVATNGADGSKSPQGVEFSRNATTSHPETLLTSADVMVIAFDQSQPMYAYGRPAGLALNPPTKSDRVVFRPYQPQTRIDPGEGEIWTIVMEDTTVPTPIPASGKGARNMSNG